MARKSTSTLSRLASRVLAGANATQKEIMQLATSVLGQDDTSGTRKAKKRKAKKGAAKKRKVKKTSSAKKRK